MFMHATVLVVRKDRLFVRDHSTSQEVLVHTSDGCGFQPGDHICIQYSGAMTKSIPPQISAVRITKKRACGR